MSRFISILFQDPSQSILRPRVSEAKHQAHYKKKLNFKSQSLNQVLSKKDKCLLHNSVGIMIEEICLFVLIIRIPYPNWFGKSQFNLWIITITCQSSSMGQDKSSILTDRSQFWEPMTYLTRAETKFYQSFLN
jgi:hypothetical protein